MEVSSREPWEVQRRRYAAGGGGQELCLPGGGRQVEVEEVRGQHEEEERRGWLAACRAEVGEGGEQEELLVCSDDCNGPCGHLAGAVRDRCSGGGGGGRNRGEGAELDGGRERGWRCRRACGAGEEEEQQRRRFSHRRHQADGHVKMRHAAVRPQRLSRELRSRRV
eukprot:759815-Hanusia_phi.AAC.2